MADETEATTAKSSAAPGSSLARDDVELSATLPPPTPPALTSTVPPADPRHSFTAAAAPPAKVHGPRSTLPMRAPPELAETRESLAHSQHGEREQPSLPDRLGRYVVLSQLGAGGMGVVYKAYDPELDRRVALKLLLGPATSHAAARLKREAQAMARLSHPNVVPIFDVGEVGDRLFVAMDLVDGATLSTWMETRHPWPAVVDLFVGAGRGLAAAHAVGLVHRDFKPESGLASHVPENTAVSRLRRGYVPSMYQAGGPRQDQAARDHARPMKVGTGLAELVCQHAGRRMRARGLGR